MLRPVLSLGAFLAPNSFCVKDLPCEASVALEGVVSDGEGETTFVALVNDSDLLPLPRWSDEVALPFDASYSSRPRLLSLDDLPYDGW